ncbi:MAG: hypothetical protein QME90_17015, partial [Thermodesulfobacteriota bacterium]|nr:hypothetical protein [Thermodesulfobacteriota bacterium]
MERNKRNRNKEIELIEQGSKRSYSLDQSSNVLIPSNESDNPLDNELSGLGIGNESFLAIEEEEVVEYELESFGKTVDPVGIYLK